MVSHPKRLGTLESTMKRMTSETFEYDTAKTSDHIHMSFLKPVHKQGPLLYKTSALKTFLAPSQVLHQISYSAYRLPQGCQLGYSMNLPSNSIIRVAKQNSENSERAVPLYVPFPPSRYTLCLGHFHAATVNRCTPSTNSATAKITEI
jgi:hypothetical protein